MSNPIPLKELSSGLMVNKSIIPCIEGRFTKMFPSKPQEVSFEGKASTIHSQGGEITDAEGTVHSIKISSKRQPTTYDRGDTVYRISCKDAGKGLKGVSMNTWEDKKTGQEKRQIAVDADKALIECVSGSPPKQQSQASKPAQQAQSPVKSSPPARIGMQIGNALNNATLLLVHGLIPVGDHGAIATLEDTAKAMLLMSDRLEGFTGKLETLPAEQTKEREEDKLQPSNTAINWKTVMHPTRRITLLEIAQNHTYEFYQMLATTLKGGAVADSDKEVFNGLLACISEREMTPKKITHYLIWKHPNYGSVFEEKNIAESLEAVTGRENLMELTDNDWKLVLSQYQQILEELNSK